MQMGSKKLKAVLESKTQNPRTQTEHSKMAKAVKIISSCTVVPKHPTPTGYMNLSEIDQIQRLKHTPVIYFYNPTNTDINLISVLRESLSLILVHYYPLAGRLRKIERDRFKLEFSAMGVKLYEAESDSKIAEFGDFAPHESAMEGLIPRIDYNSSIESWPLLLVQLTRFSCGGLCLVVATPHVLMDGWATFQFINSWAKLARGEKFLNPHEVPSHDRSNLLHSSEPMKTPGHDHIELKPGPLLLGCSDSKSEEQKETSVAILRLSKEQVEILKKEANAGFERLEDKNSVAERQNSSGNRDYSGRRPYSTYEAVAAHMWRTACKARRHDKNQPTVIRVVSNVRSRLKPKLGSNYSGNANFRMWTPICFSGDIISKPLSYGSEKIRAAIEMFTDECVRSSLDFIAALGNLSQLRVESLHTHFYGNPNMSIGSLMNMPLYDADFGWGKPVFLSLGFLKLDGKSYVIPSPEGDGSVIVALRLQTAHMEAFKKFFYEDINITMNSKDGLDQPLKARL